MTVVTIQSPSGESFQIEAPEGATDEQILRFAQSQGLMNIAETPLDNEDVPTPENLAIPAPGAPERSFMDKVVGAGEAGLTLATGATGGALGYLANAPDAALNTIRGDENAFDSANNAASELTYTPKSEAGKEYVKFISDKLSTLPPSLGGAPVGSISPIAGSKFGVGKLLKTSRGKRQIISDEIASGNINAGNIAKTLSGSGELISNPNVKTAIKLMGNDEAGTMLAINAEKMNNATRKQFNVMLDRIAANKKSGDPVMITENRSIGVVGDSLAKRVITLNDIKKAASKQVGELVNGDMGTKSVSVKAARDNFTKGLLKSDITLGRNEEGNIIADTSKTLTNIDDVIPQGRLNNYLNRLDSGTVTAAEAHKMKRNLRELVSFDKQKIGSSAVSDEIAVTVKQLATELGDSISKIDSKYKAANKAMSDSFDALKKADKMLGNELMIGDELASMKLGDLSRKIGSNYTSGRVQINSLIEALDSSLDKFGKKPKDDIKRQVSASAYLDQIFKLESKQAPVGLQSRVGQGVTEGAISGALPVREAAALAADQFKKINKLDFDDKMKALRALSKPKIKQKKGNN